MCAIWRPCGLRKPVIGAFDKSTIVVKTATAREQITPGTASNWNIGNIRRVLVAHTNCDPFAIWGDCRIVDVTTSHNFARVIFAIGYPQVVIDGEVDLAFEEILGNVYL